MDRTRVLLVDDEKAITDNLLAVILPRIRRQRERAEHVPGVPPCPKLRSVRLTYCIRVSEDSGRGYSTVRV